MIPKNEIEEFLFELVFDCESFIEYVRQVKELYPYLPWMNLKEYWGFKLGAP